MSTCNRTINMDGIWGVKKRPDMEHYWATDCCALVEYRGDERETGLCRNCGFIVTYKEEGNKDHPAQHQDPD